MLWMIHFIKTSQNQWWEVTKYIYSSTVLKVQFGGTCTLIVYFHFLLIYTSTPLHLRGKVLYFLLHYIYLITSSHFAGSDY